MSGSSGFGSAISNCIEESTVEMLSDGLQAPFETKCIWISGVKISTLTQKIIIFRLTR